MVKETGPWGNSCHNYSRVPGTRVFLRRWGELAASIAVFQLVSSCQPALERPHSRQRDGTITAGLHAFELDLDLVTGLYNRVDEFPTPAFASQWMRLPCLAFRITSPSFRNGSIVFRVQASALGVVEIKSRQNIAGLALGPIFFLTHMLLGTLTRLHRTRTTYLSRTDLCRLIHSQIFLARRMQTLWMTQSRFRLLLSCR